MGRGQLLVSCHGCHWYLRVADGRRYRLPAATERVTIREDDVSEGGSLSPDGRWLVVPTVADHYFEYAYRDLLGATVRVSGLPLAWSPDGRYVVTQTMDQLIRRIDLESGAEVPLGGPGRIDGVLPTGEVLLLRPSTITVLDPATDRRREVTPGATAQPQWFGLATSRDGREVALLTGRAGQLTIVRFALADGHPLGRLPLAQSEVPHGYGLDGALLVCTSTDLVRIDPVTGQRTVLTHVPPGVDFRPRGLANVR